jgi:hypothetical protein
MIFTKTEFDTYFKFSSFFYLKQGGFDETDRLWAEDNLACYVSFDDFVKNWFDKNDSQSFSHFLPQCWYVCSSEGELLVDFVGHFENLEEDYAYIRQRIGGRSKLPHINKSIRAKTDYREYYSEESKRIVADVYREDVAMFGYNFDRSDQK